ncbi:uncharacterized protein LOC131709656 [Acipenser ruthenus]|uniref:uncharacterized protein LOC131709656 n=1 Tax=Acipenser ruthenus TaxID=7906 RepID=UPI0027411CAC|nr:uncharacterized protein LOC131709656 [Acipenser ruthenus]
MQKQTCEKPEAQAESSLSTDKNQYLPSTSSHTEISVQPSSAHETALINCTPQALQTDSNPQHALQNSPPEISQHSSDIQSYSNSHDAPFHTNSSSQSSPQGILQLYTKAKDTFQTLRITFNPRDQLQPVQSNSNSQYAPMNNQVSDSNSQGAFQSLELSSNSKNELPTLQLDPNSQNAPVDIQLDANSNNEALDTQLDSISQSVSLDTQLDPNFQTVLSTLQQTSFDVPRRFQEDSQDAPVAHKNFQDAPTTLQLDSISLTPQQDPASQDAPLGLQSNSTPQEAATPPHLDNSSSQHALAATLTDEVCDSVLSILSSEEVSALLGEGLVSFSPEPTILQLLEFVLDSEAIDSTDCSEMLLGPWTSISTQETTLTPPNTFKTQADPEVSSTEAMEPVRHPESDQEGQTSKPSLERGRQTPGEALVACLLDENNHVRLGDQELQQLSSGGAEISEESCQTSELNQESSVLRPDQGEVAAPLKGEPAGELNQDVRDFGESQTFTLTEESASVSTADGEIEEKDRDESPLGDSPPEEFIIGPPNSVCSSPTAIEANANPETFPKDSSQMSQENIDLANQTVSLAAPFLEDLAKSNNVEDLSLSSVVDSNLVQEKDHTVLQVFQDEAHRSSTDDLVPPDLSSGNRNKVCQDLLKDPDNSSVSSDSNALCVKDQSFSQEKVEKGGSVDLGIPGAYLFNFTYICTDTVGKYPDSSVVLTVGEKPASDHDKEHSSVAEIPEDRDPSEGNMEREDMTQGIPDSDIQAKLEARSSEGQSEALEPDAPNRTLEDQEVPTLVEARLPVKLIRRCCCRKTKNKSASCSSNSIGQACQSGSLNPDPPLGIGEANQLSSTMGAKTKLKRGHPRNQDKKSSRPTETNHPTQQSDEDSISEPNSEQLPKKLKGQRRGRRRKISNPDLRQVSNHIAGEASIQIPERDLVEGGQLERDPWLGEENRQGCAAVSSANVPKRCGRKGRTNLTTGAKKPGKGRCPRTKYLESVTSPSPSPLDANSSLTDMPFQSIASGSTKNEVTRSNRDQESDNTSALAVSRSRCRRRKQNDAVPVQARTARRRCRAENDSIAARTTKRRKKN